MTIRFDWKFVIASIIALAGVAIPLYLWQFDLTSHSLTVRVVSSSALQPSSSEQFRDLQITLNGSPVPSPYLSTFELENTGSKPILTADFEGAIQILSQGKAKFISAQLVGTEPKDIPVSITNSDEGMKISPFLFNPKDKVTISLVTSGDAPSFSVRSRIAGVKEVEYEDTSVKKGSMTRLIVSSIIGAISVILYIYYAMVVFNRNVSLSRPLRLVTAFVCLIAGVSLTKKASEELTFFTSYSTEIGYGSAVLFILTVILFSIYSSMRVSRKVPHQ
ncbi:hypothetical protein [Pseudomonas lurida]|uniref:hypothetical protein n=1 Tax=Pseudomonas lurida TaxID=244566 RepID=UPI001F31E7D4|nr:hypothetical protein [Pseudomonas lurida]MCF5024700.1 hypothetical protein [Pseudomonas lurida]MCF5307459.1 hypothetical protein [Pseudomonas lurida]MCF5324516.1 hypothetical protein [Pseudomonas lurida]